MVFCKYRSIQMNQKQLGCHKSRSASSSIVMAVWNNQLQPENDSTCRSDIEYRPTRIEYFARHAIAVDGENQSHVPASVAWFKKHPLQYSCGKPVTVWECDLFEHSYYRLIPVQFILSRTISLIDTVDTHGAHALFVVPCINFYHIIAMHLLCRIPCMHMCSLIIHVKRELRACCMHYALTVHHLSQT